LRRLTRPLVASAAVVVAAGWLSGCEIATVEVAVPADIVVAESYLRPELARQEVFLYRTTPGADSTVRVTGAEVRVRDEAGVELIFFPGFNPTVRQQCAYYTHVPEGDGGSCYTSIPVPDFVRPGGTYWLEVTLQDGRRLTSRTTVPGDFEVTLPGAAACIVEPASSFRLVWTQSEEARAYQTVANFRDLAKGLAELGVSEPPNELELVGLSVGGADTTIVFPGEFGVFDRFTVERDLLLALQVGLPSGARAEIIVAAGDQNYVNWVRGGNFNPSGQVRVPSISDDGTGVFGSIVVRRRHLLTRDDGSGLPNCQ